MAAWAPFHFIEKAVERAEQCIAGPGGDAAAKDERFRIETIDEGSHCGRQSAHGSPPDLDRIHIAMVHRRQQIMGRGELSL